MSTTQFHLKGSESGSGFSRMLRKIAQSVGSSARQLPILREKQPLVPVCEIVRTGAYETGV